MICDCLPDPILMQFPTVSMTDSVLNVGGASYGPGLPVVQLPTVNPSFLILKNEVGVDSLYFMQSATAEMNINCVSAGSVNGVLTASSERLAIRLFGGRPKPAK